MRSALFFAALALLLVSTHAWQRPSSWREFEEKARERLEEAKKHVAAMQKHLPPNMQHMVQQAMEKLEEHHARQDVHHAISALRKNLMSRWRNVAATQGLQVRDHRALEALMKHVMLTQARHNMEQSTLMETYAHHLATHLIGEKRSAQDIKVLAARFSNLVHTYKRKFVEGAEAIMRKNGVNLNHEQVQEVMHHACAEAMKGKNIMQAMMAAMNKVGVHTAGLDVAVQNELKAHFEKLRMEGMAEVQKIMTDHKIPMKIEQVIAAIKMKAKEMMEKMKAMHNALPKTTMHKMEELLKKAFKNMKPGDHKKIMMQLHLIVRPALRSHFQMIVHILKKHKMGVNHVVVHYTIYHQIRKEIKDHDDDDDHHHRWWHKKIVRVALIGGGSVFGVAVLVALIVVVVHMVKEKRRVPNKKGFGGEEKSTLPYSIMDEKSSTKA